MYTLTILNQNEVVLPKENGITIEHLAWCLEKAIENLQSKSIDEAIKVFSSDMSSQKPTLKIYDNDSNNWNDIFTEIKAIYNDEKIQATDFSVKTDFNGEIKFIITDENSLSKRHDTFSPGLRK